VDVSIEKAAFEEAIATKKGKILADACNEHLYATVWCPWGESEYLHKCGSVPLDLVVCRLFGDCIRTVVGNARMALQKVTGILDDFLDGNYACILYNPAWQVRPSIAFINGVPVVLTCRKHNRGCKGRYFHLPHNPKGVLSSWESDQLTPAVIRPRTLKQLKVHKYSDSYQMQEMQGQYNGVDTVRVCEHHNFATDSKLLRDREEVALSGRKDLRLLVTGWGQDGTLPADVAKCRIADATSYGPSEEESAQSCRGATFMTLKDSLKLQGMNKTNKSRVIRLKVNGEWQRRHFVPPWPTCIVNVHPYNKHGCTFPLLPKMYHSEDDIRLAFYLAAMHSCIPDLWESTSDSIVSCTDWQGWLLTYLARKCFNSCSVRPRNNPFTFARMKKEIDALDELLVRIGLREGVVPTGENRNANGSRNEVDHDGDDDLGTDESDLSTVSSMGWNQNDAASIGWNDDVTSSDSDSTDSSSMGWTSDEVENGLFTDGFFHVSDLELLFERHDDVLVTAMAGLANILAMVQMNARCIIVYRSFEDGTASDMKLDNELLCHNNCTWELRFIGGCNHVDTNRRFILARHGGVFPLWWKQTYRKVRGYDYERECLLETDVNVHCREWEVAVYVRKESITLEACRDIILQSMSSQTHMFCQEHDIPLVTAPFATNAPCAMNGTKTNACSRSISWRCPVQACNSAVCKTHGEEAIENGTKLYV
jgi:hypothetical protein